MSQLGVDTGGTFTDLVWIEGSDRSQVRTAKVPSQPADPSRAVLRGLSELDALGDHPPDITHGTTVALNALLTGRGARVAMVTNQGFLDLIEIGRQDRPELYALEPKKADALVPRQRRFEINQRSAPDSNGKVVRLSQPTAQQLDALRQAISQSDAESVAICLLHSYADPAIETEIGEALRELGLPITCSSQVLPTYREVERFSTALVNAASVPVLRSYLTRLEQGLGGASLAILQNSGGTISAREAADEPVRVLLSGPAGGVVGAARAAREAGLGDIVTLDMGGTSTDVAFHSADGGVTSIVRDARVADHPIAVPTLDLHTIGCGGGSIVYVDKGGILHVGPRSAGADPGPVCYGRGDEPTVTDAHVLLGHVRGEGGSFMDGALALDTDRVHLAFEVIGKQLGVAPTIAAQGVLDVARAAMRRALGVKTMQRGSDPAHVPLVSFGGAGGLSAAALAKSLGMPGALIPAMPGVLSAFGMACADAVRDHVRSVLAPLSEWDSQRRKQALTKLADFGRDELIATGHDAAAIEYEFALELRYAGQAFELTVAESVDPREIFHQLHERRYGWCFREAELELVQLGARAVVRRKFAERTSGPERPASTSAVLDQRQVGFAGKMHATPIYDRSALKSGHWLAGPAVLEEFSGTTLVPPAWHCQVRTGEHLWLTPDSTRS